MQLPLIEEPAILGDEDVGKVAAEVAAEVVSGGLVGH